MKGSTSGPNTISGSHKESTPMPSRRSTASAKPSVPPSPPSPIPIRIFTRPSDHETAATGTGSHPGNDGKARPREQAAGLAPARPAAASGRTLRWHWLHDDQEVRVPDQRPATGPEATNQVHQTPEHGNPDGRSPQGGSPEYGSPASGDGLPPGGIAAVDAIADGFQLRAGQPGLAYGIVAAGSLVHARGLGERRLGGAVPDAGTVFRIASMTKSFTASAILALRDDDALALDDLAEEYVPELRGLRPATADSPQISIRHLLTMTAGFPTDDPWGD